MGFRFYFLQIFLQFFLSETKSGNLFDETNNLSGIILIDFINMANPDHNDELFHVLQKYLRKDPVKCKAVDITPLHILEMTRKKVRRPVIEEIRQIRSGSTIADAK